MFAVEYINGTQKHWKGGFWSVQAAKKFIAEKTTAHIWRIFEKSNDGKWSEIK